MIRYVRILKLPQQCRSHPVGSKLIRYAAAVVPLAVGPLNGSLFYAFIPNRSDIRLLGEFHDPLPDYLDILILRKRMETDPESKPAGKRYLFFNRLPVMNLVVDQHRASIIGLVFRQQMAPVGRDVDSRVFRRGIYGSVQGTFQHLVTNLADFERDVIGEDYEPVRFQFNRVDDSGQVNQIIFVHLDNPEAFRGIAIKEGPNHG